jgi:hypothetical protein
MMESVVCILCKYSVIFEELAFIHISSTVSNLVIMADHAVGVMNAYIESVSVRM